MTRLGVNIDHVATVRNARGSFHPDPFTIAKHVTKCGAHSDNYTFKRRQKTYKRYWMLLKFVKIKK